VRDVEELLRAPSAATAGPDTTEWSMPAWNRSWPVRWFRRASLASWVLPLARLFARLRVEGLERLEGVEGPVLFASNHQSHLDTPAIFAALPRAWRYRVAVAMAKEFFDAHFHPEGRGTLEALRSGALYRLAALFFNAFPLPQREAGARRTLQYIGELLGDGWSVLIYPEGERTDDGSIRQFRPGVGMIASRLAVPVIPVRLEGLEKVLHKSWHMARPGPVRIAFGAPLRLVGDDYSRLSRQVEEAVRAL
jgi:long-chain acyl-CoA synthetase